MPASATLDETQAARPNASAPGEDAPAADAQAGLLSRAKLQMGLGLTVLLLICGGVTWWFARPAMLSPAEQVNQALGLLEQQKFTAAREIAERLERRSYRHPGSAGILKFIEGVATFRLAEASGEPVDHGQYDTVIKHLREAERLAIGKDRQPDWCYALGKSLYLAGDGYSARPLLEESLEIGDAAQRADAGEMLVDLYLDPGVRTPDLLDRAMTMSDELVRQSEIPTASDRQIRRIAAWLQRAEILLAMNRFEDARAALAEISQSIAELDEDAFGAGHSSQRLLQILDARILLAEEKYPEAMDRLRPIAMANGITDDHAAEACYLMGLANERLSERESQSNEAQQSSRREAIFFLERAADRFAGTPEATAANLHLGRLWGLQGSQEQSLQAYGSALRSVPTAVETYRNRWLSLGQFRQAVVDAWNDWVASKQFKEAIALSEMMTPLFPGEEAYEFAARVHQRWAEDLEEHFQDSTYSEREQLTEELRRRWRQSGEAYVRLAEVRVSSSKYPEALWNAAEHFRRGHDFERSLTLINQFVATEPERLMAAALVQRARIELDLDQIPEALKDLQQVVKKFPTDPTMFAALYLVGVCHFEQNQLDQAEAVWRGILLSEQLLPSAVEWRDSQLALGRLMFERGELVRRKLVVRSKPAEASTTQEVYEEASPYWQEAIGLLSRYLDRYAGGQGATEARYYLGKSLQREAEWLTRQWEVAETDNARQQLQKQQDTALNRALQQFELLRDELLEGQNKDRIDGLERRLLMNCFFEIPHTLFQLRAYGDAIDAYNSAVSRYPQDVQTLVAFLQMGQCYHQLGKAEEARSMLQQAKVILSYKEHIPDAAFQAPSTSLSRAEWEAWLERAKLAQ